MKQEFVNHWKELFSSPKKCVLFPHKNPDGDALGSTLALARFLSKQGHQCQIISPNEYPKFLRWMPGQENILCYNLQEVDCKKHIEEAEVFLTLDFNSLQRISPLDKFLTHSPKPIIMIDHHEAPHDYDTLRYSDPSIGSTCEMVYNVMKFINPAQIDKEIGQCIYTGMMTDSGSFRFSSTTSTTHLIASELLALGINHAQIHQNIYDSSRFERLQLLGITLGNLTRVDNLQAVYTSLSQSELDQCNFQKGDTEGFVNYGLSLEGIELAVIMIENKQEGIIKMSFRSKGSFDVNQFARKYFNGGGHKNAAGGMTHLTLEKTTDLLESNLLKYRKSLS